jgi:hypothetical protein
MQSNLKQAMMRFFVVIIIAIFFAGNVFPQEIESRVVYYNRIEPVQMQLSKFPHGNVQWQVSEPGGEKFRNIDGAQQIPFQYEGDSSACFRSVIISGTCDTVVSQLIKLYAFELATLDVGGITDTSANIFCGIDTLDVNMAEYGLLYNTAATVDDRSEKIVFPMPVRPAFDTTITELEAGRDYYARAYGKAVDGTILYGNILQFTPVKVNLQQNFNPAKNAATFFYSVSGIGTESIVQHGVCVNALTGEEEAVEFNGSVVDEKFTAEASGLKAGTEYFVTAYILTEDDSRYYSTGRQIKTWSEYDGPVENAPFTVAHRIVWNNPATAKKISQDGTFGEYGRIARLHDTDTLLLVYHGGPNNGDWISIYMRKSFDNGDTWQPQETIMNLADYPGQYWRFCTPEIMVLQNGWVIVAYEANARPDENQSSVQMLISRDSANTWEPPVVYITGRTWEPAMIQLPKGEIELFYSSEEKWWPGSNIYQDIQVIRSTDNGMSWSEPEVVAYYPQKRDGMPVPVVLDGNKGVIFAIETVNVGTSPYIIHRDMNAPWVLTESNFEDSPHRWYVNGFSGHGGAPYILQLPTGETVLTVHIYRGGDWRQNNYQQVMIGDNGGKNFEGLANPWGNLPWGEGAINNSLFLKDDSTIVTVTSRKFTDGSGGIYWLEGSIVPK